MISKYLLILGIAHLLGDFYFQSERMARKKDKTYKGVLVHCAEYYVVALLVVLPVFSPGMAAASALTAFTHFVIDTVKYLYLAKKRTMKKNGRVFVADQCAHALSIFMLAYLMYDWNFTIGHITIVNRFLIAYGCEPETFAKWLFVVLILHKPANILIQNLLGAYKPKAEDKIIKADNRIGRRIGTMERLIMLAFLSVNQYTAMGFVLTAKSIARYDKIAKDEKFAEYYLLGTLVSVLCVILCRMLILN